MLTHFKSTMRVLHMLMHLTSGSATLLLGKFQPPELTPPIGLRALGGHTLGFFTKSSLYHESDPLLITYINVI